RDITESKRLEQARQEVEDRLQLAVDIAHLGFWEWNVATGDCYFSIQYQKQLGYENQELTPRKAEWISRLHPDDRRSVLAATEKFLAQPDTDYHFEYRLRHRDGSYRCMVANAIVLEGHAGGKK